MEDPLIRLAANLSWLFQEHDFLDRFQAAADCGFKGVEVLFPYEWPADKVAAKAAAAKVEMLLINAPAGDWAAGGRGHAAVPGAEGAFAQGLATGLAYARATGCPRLHVMSGVAAPGPVTERLWRENMTRAAEAAEALGIHVLTEPLNPWDVPGYFLSSYAQARRLLPTVGHANLRLQLDLYHAQRTDGGLCDLIDCVLPVTAHVQIAGVPGRNEPDATGEVNWPHLFAKLADAAFGGWVACEYKPRAATRAGLGWAKDYGVGG
jgi:hydroxypyruvate isomerase